MAVKKFSPPQEAETVDAATAKVTFRGYLWEVAKHPFYYIGGNPLVQSAAAFGINLWCLVFAVLAQFWVFFSAALLLAQCYITWMVWFRRMGKFVALAIGLALVVINILALVLAVLGQVWVFVSAGLSIWQYVCLIRVCWPSKTVPTRISVPTE